MDMYYKKFHDISKITLWAEGAEGSDGTAKQARLVLSFRDGNPRFVVYTGIPGVAGMINFPSDYPTMASAMHMLLDIANKPDTKGVIYSIDSLTTKYENNKPTREKVVVSTLNMGRDNDGVVFMAVLTEGKPKIVFKIKPSNYHQFRDSSKNPIPDSVISSVLAKSIANLTLEVISSVMISYTKEEYISSGKPPTELKPNPNAAAKNPRSNANTSPTEIGSIEDIDL